MNTHQMRPREMRSPEQSQLHITRRSMTTSRVANPQRGHGDSVAEFPALCSRSGAGHARTSMPEVSRPSEPVPIWLAVLLATACEAQRNGENHAVRWNLVSGRAIYTNAGRDAEHIEPLGVSLLGGHTMAVSWMPGETAYTVEVYRQTELCA